MATYYVGPSAAGAEDGSSWANRYGSLNDAEDTPVAAGDIVYVGPGVYREMLTCDVSGSSGNPITYIGDVTGENTDGVGGVVRITGSDNDQSATRSNCVAVSSKEYRTFKGFAVDGGSAWLFYLFGSNFTLEDCVARDCASSASAARTDGDFTDFTIRRCVFFASTASALEFIRYNEGSGNHLVENCLFVGGQQALYTHKVYDLTFKNNLVVASYRGMRTATALSAGSVYVYNNIFSSVYNWALGAAELGDIIEDYNTFYGCGSDRSNVGTGANSVSYPALLNLPILFDGIKLPWWFGELSKWSQVRAIAGTSEASDDLFGVTRPTTSAKKSWGPIQFHDTERETGTTRNASAASIVLHDAARHQVWVPVDNTEITISVYVYREANYAGTNPQLIVKQPGQSDDTTTDAAAASQWNQLSTTLTPSADTDYVVVELVSSNTATSGDYDVFFDDLSVS